MQAQPLPTLRRNPPRAPQPASLRAVHRARDRRGAGLVLAATLSIVALLFTSTARAEEGSDFPTAPRDEDGRFQNLDADLPMAGVEVRLPFLLRQIVKRGPTPENIPPRVENRGEFLRRNTDDGVPTITWVGHATFLVQMEDQTFLTDPIWSERASPLGWAGPERFQPPGIALDDLPPIDFVLISHNHYDHLDLATLAEIAIRNTTARFLVPLENGELLREAGIPNVEEMAWGESTQVGELTVHCLPSQHWSRRGLLDGNATLWASWAVLGPKERFYFAGDTGYFSSFKEIGKHLGPFDVAAVPIGAYRPRAMMRAFHMNPGEAVRAGRELGARRLIGMHYGTFDLSDEPSSEATTLFREAGRTAGYERDEILLPAVGETLIFQSGSIAAAPPPPKR